jgi:hypothetical protein
MNGKTVLLRTLPASALLALLSGTAPGQCGLHLAFLSASNKAIGDQLGRAISLSPVSGGGLTMMVGAQNRDVAGQPNSGAVYSFGRINNIWGQLSQIVPNDPTNTALFGRTLDYADPYLIVGAPAAGPGGAVYLFNRAGATWTQSLKWSDGAGNGGGGSVTIDATNGIAFAGSPSAEITAWGNVITDGGAVRMFKRNASGDWVYDSYFILSGQEEIYHPGDRYGASVAVSDWRFVAGAPGFDVVNPATQALVPNAGCFQYKQYAASFSIWYYDEAVTHPSPAPDDNFGAVIAFSGQYVAVTAPGRDIGNATDVGVVYVFRRHWDFWTPEWTLEATLQPTVPITNAGFGSTLDLSGERLVVGSNGQHQVHLFRRLPSGQWVQEARYLDPDGPDAFGEGVAISGSDMVIGDPMEDPAGITDAGVAYVYQVAGVSADSCVGATPVVQATAYAGCTQNATVDGSNNCGGLSTSPDVWFTFVSPSNGMLPLNTFGSSIDTVLSVHAGCPGSAANTLACNDDFSVFENGSAVTFPVVAGQAYQIRVSGKGTARGAIALQVGQVQVSCYANCDGSTTLPILNVQDFTCFLQRYAAGDTYANCDQSTTAPVLNVQDFTCFLQQYAAGCP